MSRKQIKILYIETIEIRLLDIPRTLDELGYDVYKAALNITAQGYHEKDCRKIIAAIDKFGIQCAISYDFAESIAQACHETGIPYISWVYDAPQKELYTHYAMYPCNYIFVFDKMQQMRLKQIGIRNVYHMPLAVHSVKIEKALSGNTRQDENEITFVGQLYKIDHLEQIVAEAGEKVRYDVENIINSCYLQWDKDKTFHGRLGTESINYFSELDNQKIPKQYPYITEQFYYEAAVLSRLLANRERVNILNHLAEHYDVKFYTNDKDTTQLSKNVTVLPGVQYDDEISRIYHNSKINLNITLHCIETGASQRVFDVMAAGGFLISNYQKELEELFVVGEEIILYHNEKELVELVKYYLAHEEERREIARRGQKKVLQYHNFHRKMQYVMELVIASEAPREETYIAMQRKWLKDQADMFLLQKSSQGYEKLYTIFSDLQYETTIQKTTALGYLREMLKCWKMELETGESNIFSDIGSLEQAERKYLSIKHCLWRIEMKLSYERCMEAVAPLYNNKTSKLLIIYMIHANLRDREYVYLQLSRYMREYSTVDAIEMLSYGLLFYPKNQEFLLQKAEYLMELGMWEAVLVTLQFIENPSKEITEMIEQIQDTLGEKGNEQS